MKYSEQLKRLESIIEQIRILQESGLWELLQDAKIELGKVHTKVEASQTQYLKNKYNGKVKI